MFLLSLPTTEPVPMVARIDAEALGRIVAELEAFPEVPTDARRCCVLCKREILPGEKRDETHMAHSNCAELELEDESPSAAEQYEFWQWVESMENDRR